MKKQQKAHPLDIIESEMRKMLASNVAVVGGAILTFSPLFSDFDWWVSLIGLAIVVIGIYGTLHSYPLRASYENAKKRTPKQ